MEEGGLGVETPHQRFSGGGPSRCFWWWWLVSAVVGIQRPSTITPVMQSCVTCASVLSVSY